MSGTTGRREHDLERVGDLLDEVISRLGGDPGAGSALLWEDWHHVAGPGWEGSWPLKLEAGVLSVAVPDGMSATRLRYQTAELMRRIGDRVGRDVVSSVTIRVRPRKRGS